LLVQPFLSFDDGDRSLDLISDMLTTEEQYHSTPTTSVEEIRSITPLSNHFVTHLPIFINSNADFATQALAENWDLGGTRNGSKNKPYIISGYNITNSTVSELIAITTTDVFFEVRDNYLNGVSNSASAGIDIDTSDNAIVDNNIIIECEGGILLNYVNNANVTNNMITDISSEGITIEQSTNVTLKQNIIQDSKIAIRVRTQASNNSIISNQIDNAIFGIMIQASSDSNRIDNNTLTDSGSDGIQITGSDFITASNNRLTTTVNRAITLSSSSNSSITNNQIDDASIGLAISFSSNSFIKNNTVVNAFSYDIQLEDSDNNTISGNSLTNGFEGIDLCSSNYNQVFDNYFANHGEFGIYIEGGNYNQIYNNTILNSTVSGITLEGVTGNIVRNNYIADSGQNGIRFIYVGFLNVFSSNTVVNSSGYGVSLAMGAANNTISWNNFIGNNASGVQGFDDSPNNTIFNNYWSDQLVPDVGMDGIVDVPYEFDGQTNNSDQFPLTEIHALTIPSISSPITDQLYFDQLVISWNQSSDSYDHDIRYDLFYRNGESLDWNLIAENTTSTNYTWDISTFNNQSGYTIIIVATAEHGLSTATISDQFNIGVRLPSIPQNVVAVRSVANITITWDPAINLGVPQLIEYRVYRGLTNQSYSFLASTTGTSFTDITPMLGQTYLYVVVSFNAVGESNYSNSVSITHGTVATAPEMLQYSLTSGVAHLTWNVPVVLARKL